MSCSYCENRKNIFEVDRLWTGIMGWCPEIKAKELDTQSLGLFIDRGYLRLVDLDDCGCLDHGEKKKIEYCCFCGEYLGDDR